MKISYNILKKIIKEEIDSSISKKLIIVDVQPEYKSAVWFDIREMIEYAVENYNRILVLYNGPDLGFGDEDDLKNFYRRSLDPYADPDEEFYDENEEDEELFDKFERKSIFFEKGYAFFRDWMDTSCVVKSNLDVIATVVKWMMEKGYNDIRDIDEEDHEFLQSHKIDVDELEMYGLFIPDLADILPQWNHSDIIGGGRHECLSEVEILAAALDMTLNPINQYIYQE